MEKCMCLVYLYLTTIDKEKQDTNVILSMSTHTHAGGSSKHARHIPDGVCTVFELLMTGGGTA